MNIINNLTNVNYKKYNGKRDIRYIVIHYTAGKKDYPGAAYDNTRYFKDVYRGASAHYFVDMSDDIYRCVDDNDIAWHVGDRANTSRGAAFYKKCTNSNSIGVEMVSYYEDVVYKISDKTLKNTALITSYLMKKHLIPIENVICHFDVTGKICPAPWIEDNRCKNKEWEAFLSMVSSINKPFNDIDDHWAKEYIMKLYDYGIVSGDGKGNFYPDRLITRAEAAKMVSDALLILGK